MALYVLPDATLAVIQYLLGVAEITALVDAAHVVSQIPATNVTYPYIVVTVGGGSGIWPAVDEPAVQVDVVGGSKPTCSLIARVVRAAIWDISGAVVPAGTLCSGEDEMAPAYIPDTVPTPPLPRYTARYRILTHP